MQVVAEENGVRRIVEHLGSAHDEAELAALMRLGRERILAGRHRGRRSTAAPVSRVKAVRREGRRSPPAGRAG